MIINVDDSALRRALRKLGGDLRNMRPLYIAAARAIRDEMRNRITSQTTNASAWAPLAGSTRAKTGRRKALITARSQITAAASNVDGRVHAPEHLKYHDKGYTVPPSEGPFAWTLITGKTVYLPYRQAYSVPKRRVSLTLPEASKLVARIGRGWKDRITTGMK